MSVVDESIYKVVYGPHVTEKAVSGSDVNVHVFKVSAEATKPEIRKSIELLFEVKVASVKTVNVKGKAKNFGKRQGTRKNWKKAYVRLMDGQSLEVSLEG